MWIHHCWSQWWALCSWIWPMIELKHHSLIVQDASSWHPPDYYSESWYIGLLTDSGFSWFMSVVLPLLSSPTQRTLASLFLSPSHVTKLSKKPMVLPNCANCWVGSGQYLPWHNVVSMVTSNACVMRFPSILGVPKLSPSLSRWRSSVVLKSASRQAVNSPWRDPLVEQPFICKSERSHWTSALARVF